MDMRACTIRRERKALLAWVLAALVAASAVFHGLDAATRQRLAAVIGSLVMAPADFRVAEPPPAQHAPIPLRTL